MFSAPNCTKGAGHAFVIESLLSFVYFQKEKKESLHEH
jgi:hypothetical protein